MGACGRHSRRSEQVRISQSFGRTPASPAAECSLCCFFNILVDGLARAMHDASPGFLLMGELGRFAACANTLVWCSLPYCLWQLVSSTWWTEATDCLRNACLGAVPNAFLCTRRHPSSWCEWGSEFLAGSPTAFRSLDRALRKWGRFLLGLSAGSPNIGVLCGLGWPDAERISSGRLLLGRVSSMTGGPLPVAVFQAASRNP